MQMFCADVEWREENTCKLWTNLQAQAQECILEKSMTDSRKSSITAKVAAQIVEYYKLALKNLDASNCASFVGSKKVKVSWSVSRYIYRVAQKKVPNICMRYAVE